MDYSSVKETEEGKIMEVYKTTCDIETINKNWAVFAASLYTSIRK